jgi:pSer/pThr/pTyr-binding forkhead associated (FHA) protein
MLVKLNIFDGSTLRFSKVVHLPCSIGRSRLCNVSIVHPLISRQHCEIYEDRGIVMVRDLGSMNGTYYKNTPIRRSVPIPFNDGFMISTLHFVIEEVPQENPQKEEDDFANLDSEEDEAPEDISDISDIFK